ncbi:MgtC/SapB family protein [Haloferacaceae archaeon DSL9]
MDASLSSLLQTGTFFGFTLDEPVVRLAVAAVLGLFLGLEREWSEKAAGIRTFSLTSLLAAVFTLVAEQHAFGAALLAIGGLLVITQGVLLGVRGLRIGHEGDSLALTTSVTLLVAYGVGVLVATGFILEGVTVAVLSSTLLMLKRELHGFAGGLSRQELRSAIEFAILGFVVYPLLPAGEMVIAGVPFEPRVGWLMVVTVAGIGIVNYALVRSYGGRGIAVTGFFGGLASSAAVVGAMLDHLRQRTDAVDYGVAAVLLANAAMALRNLAIAIAFTLSTGAVLFDAVVPLGILVVGSFAIAAVIADWDQEIEMELQNPFSLRNALGFGSVFLFILAGSSIAQAEFGTAGLYVSALVSGLVSSAGVTTSAVLLYRSGSIGGDEAVIAILLATAASILVKVGLASAGPRPFMRRVALWSVVLLLASGIGTAIMLIS